MTKQNQALMVNQYENFWINKKQEIQKKKYNNGKNGIKSKYNNQKNKYCAIHESKTHETHECRELLKLKSELKTKKEFRANAIENEVKDEELSSDDETYNKKNLICMISHNSSRLFLKKIFLPTCNLKFCEALIDTGSDVNLIDIKLVKKYVQIYPSEVILKAANNKQIPCLGFIKKFPITME
ncbi:hypothetical protein COBT_004157, partial [Conglomerata obtusa]